MDGYAPAVVRALLETVPSIGTKEERMDEKKTTKKKDVCAECGEPIGIIHLIGKPDGSDIVGICTACMERAYDEGAMNCSNCELPFIEGRVHRTEIRFPDGFNLPQHLCTLCWAAERQRPTKPDTRESKPYMK
jgi:hypothetical protein